MSKQRKMVLSDKFHTFHNLPVKIILGVNDVLKEIQNSFNFFPFLPRMHVMLYIHFIEYHQGMEQGSEYDSGMFNNRSSPIQVRSKKCFTL